MLWILECPVGLSQKRNMRAFQLMEIWRNLDGPPKNKELWSYVVKFEFSRLKVDQIAHQQQIVFRRLNGEHT